MPIEQSLHSEPVSRLDLSAYIVVDSGLTVREAIRQLREEKRNVALVVNDGALVGIFTDRDVLRKVVDKPETWDGPIEAVMTAAPLVVKPSAVAAEALNLMDTRNFRNVPVVGDDGQIAGNLTYYSILKFLSDHFPESVYNLPPDPEQMAKQKDGA